MAGHGRMAVYSGRVAEAISDATGGWITEHDLAANKPDWVTGASLDVFGETVWTIPHLG